MIINKIKKFLLLPITIYLLNSIIVSFIDVFIVWALYQELGIGLVMANTVGVIAGFIIHYILSSKSVFQTDFGITGFLVYFGTFLFGLVFANYLIFAGDHYIFIGFNGNLRFLLSKGISILIPFFILYIMRKILFHILKRKYEM